ncbi:hypothetical protein [Streptomyces sp. NPDC016845]|uniref:hypothetical protein n=1 Tax=Streptomyces sp. NPDC016845 TaxID=3364972 RepID=UPI0037B30EDA
MTGQRTEEQPAFGPALASGSPVWAPRRGELVEDAVAGRRGVVVAVPEDTGTQVYHLCPADGGDEWPALRIRLNPCAVEAPADMSRGEAALPQDGRGARQGDVP